jgi:ABC-type oligopeptide transport system substrate-binding subunit
MNEQVFVARERELAQLQAFLDKTLAGHGQIRFVTGEAGAGKTALVTEFARRAEAQHDDLLVAVGECNAQTGIGDPYLPFREVLGMLTGDVESRLAQGAITQENASRLQNFLRISGKALVELGPDLIEIFVPAAGLATRAGAFVAGRAGWLDRLEALAERESLDADLSQSRIFEQYTDVLRALATQQPLLLVLDDLQWADRASINLLFHLARRIHESRILIVGTYRPADVALGREGQRHPLEPTLNEIKRYFGDVWIELGQAAEAEGRAFVDAWLDTEPNRLGEGFRQALYQHTGGHPLFTIELLRDLQERGDIVRDEDGCWVETSTLDWDMLPARVEGVIEERIGRLEEELHDILTVAAVEGEDFTAQVVARVQELQERRLLRTLSRELQKRHSLVREQGEVQVDRRLLSRYRFAHALFQRYLYNDLSAGERRLLHGEIAEVLEELYAGRTDEITVQLARHFTKAGEADKAVEYLLLAGDRARGLYAHQEAIDAYQRALGFLREQGEHERAARTLMKLGLTYHTAFDFDRAREAYEEGFALRQRAGTGRLAVLAPAPHALRIPGSEPFTLDSALTVETGSLAILDQLFSGLISMGPEMEVMPDIAASWEVADGGRRYVFHLRDDVVWSDGRPVTAGDFEFAWKRGLDPATGSPSASLLYDVKGARAFHQGQIPDPDCVGVRSLDDSTLMIELEGPTGYLLYLLTYAYTYPVPRHVVESHGHRWTDAQHLVTNGPFRLLAWERGASLSLTRNPAYHGQCEGNVQQVEILVGQEGADLLALYEKDRLDLLPLTGMVLAPDEVDAARRRHAADYISLPELTTVGIGFDVSRPPFNDRRVRRAFALAVDRRWWADEVHRGQFFPGTGGFVPPGMPGHSPDIGLPHDPEQARRLLAEAGYPDGDGFPSVTLIVPDAGRATDAFAQLQQHWQATLGVEITCETMEWGAFELVKERLPHLFFQAWGADSPDPDNFLRVGFLHHQAEWRNEKYSRLVEQARRITDQAARMKLYRQADRMLVEEAVFLPLAYVRSHLLLKPWVKKYPLSPMKSWFWKDVVIEPH